MKIKIAAYLAIFIGLTGITALIAYQGFDQVFGVLSSAGWGLVAVALFHLLPLLFDAMSLYVLVDNDQRPGYLQMLKIRWMREGIDGVLPVAQVGGSLATTRLLVMRGMPGADAGAAVVLDMTVAVITQSIFTLLGLWLLVAVTGDDSLIAGILGGLGLTGLGVLGFILFQHKGLFSTIAKGLSNVGGGDRWLKLVGGAERLDRAIKSHYKQPTTLGYCGFWQLSAWFIGTGEVWLALYFLGHPVTLAEAMLLESLGQAIKNAAFVVPGALGIQEGGYMLLGSMLGLAPETGLALSLAKRIRVLSLGVPAILTWQWVEGRHLFRRKQPQKFTETGLDS